MALAGETWMIRHGNLRHGETFDLEQGRQEAVHPFEKLQVLDALAFERAIRASGVTDLFTRQFVPHPVGDARRRNAYEAVALAARFDACAADAIELLERVEKLRQIARVVLQIGIQGDE